MEFFIFFILLLAALSLLFNKKGDEQYQRSGSQYTKDPDFFTDQLLRKFKSRRSYYRDVYLKSNAWKRKRYVVMRRDNWRCVYCGAPATQVHHKHYAKKNIGKEPIDWLVSVCKPCHDSLHC